jgi:hypothetical protein
MVECPQERGENSRPTLQGSRKCCQAAIRNIRGAIMPAPDYKGFVKWVMTEGPWSGCDLDGGDVQEAAVKFGVAKEVKYDPKVHGPNDCDADAGDPWFVLAE